ncbi:hypothetical protein KC678_05885 [Candidatus Dojkabacteria bacterium]|uniref:Uncharacterized protein n=1 Tax=Candidatus Dojkabacteria bacterium TaxID=2099670 RepID=A0A955L2N8_9BACT|nr:hypothetical protein [Candidatus Dojkabacteria bacterium]
MSIVPTKDDIINCYRNQEVLTNATINNLNDKIEKLKAALINVKQDCITHVDRPWIVDYINKTLKEIK